MASKMNKKELYEAYKKLEQSHMKIEMELNDVKSDLSACEDELKEYKELFDKVRAERDDIQDDLSDEIHTLRKELERLKLEKKQSDNVISKIGPQRTHWNNLIVERNKEIQELKKFKDDVKDALQIDDDTPDKEVIEYIVEIEGEWEPPHYVNELKETIEKLKEEKVQEQEFSKIAMVKNLEYEEDIEELKKTIREKVNKEKGEYANKIADYLKKRHEKELLTIRKMLS